MHLISLFHSLLDACIFKIILTLLSMVIVVFLHYRKSRLCKGYRFSNAIKIMLFISDIQNYIPIKLCKTAGSIHLFKIKSTLKSGDIKLYKNYLWDTLEINWNGVTVTFNDNKVVLPKIIAIKICDKIKVRRLMNKIYIMDIYLSFDLWIKILFL